MSGAEFEATQLTTALSEAGKTLDVNEHDLGTIAEAAVRAARDGREFTETWAEVTE